MFSACASLLFCSTERSFVSWHVVDDSLSISFGLLSSAGLIPRILKDVVKLPKKLYSCCRAAVTCPSISDHYTFSAHAILLDGFLSLLSSPLLYRYYGFSLIMCSSTADSRLYALASFAVNFAPQCLGYPYLSSVFLFRLFFLNYSCRVVSFRPRVEFLVLRSACSSLFYPDVAQADGARM